MFIFNENIFLFIFSDNDVFIEVCVVGVNNIDLNMWKGWYFKGDNNVEDVGWVGNVLNLFLI